MLLKCDLSLLLTVLPVFAIIALLPALSSFPGYSCRFWGKVALTEAIPGRYSQNEPFWHPWATSRTRDPEIWGVGGDLEEDDDGDDDDG